MISIKQLSYALAAEKTLHFRKAAELCNISQSALSTALNELEKQLGLQIFERDNKKVLVTPIGKQVLEQARRIMLQVEELQHLADSQKIPLSFPLSVGIIPTVAPFLLPKILPALNRHYPRAQLNIVEEQSQVLVDMVRAGEIDTAILALPFPIDGLLKLEFWQEDFYWVALKDDKHAQQKEITSDELNHSNLMLLKEGHCLKDHILDACKLSEQTANHGFGATSLNTLVQMVMGRLGTTLIPEMALDQLISQNPALSAVHLNEPGPHRRIAFVIRPNYTRISSIEALIALCEAALTKKTSQTTDDPISLSPGR
ncbi:MAG: LysR substrate-binding domain-containing protein [Pseudomonadota bacterium]|nr:LysR substrate-binding domain-containing protein [Pseudomonadota bacterium]